MMKLLTLRSMALYLCTAAAVLGTSACALTSKADVVETRYFSPERVKPTLDSAAPPAPAPRGAIELKLGRVSSGTSLRERISYRDAAYELGYYEDFRWTERPDAYVRRALGRTLFEERGMHRVLGGSAPTLDVDVIAFDDLRLATGRAARVQLKIVLFQDNLVLLEDTLTVDHAVPGEKPKFEDVIAAMAMALDSASEQVTRKVEAALLARAPRER